MPTPLESALAPFARFVTLWTMVLLVSVILLAETDRLISQVATDGRVHSMSDVVGPLALANTGAWADWAAAESPPTALIAIHILVDVAFYLSYGLLAWRVVGRTRTGRFLVLVVIGIEMVETGVLAVAAGILRGGVPPGLATGEAVLAELKWAAVLCLVGYVLLSPVVRGAVIGTALLVARALWAQRLSVLVVLFLGYVGLVPGSGVLEQIADVERAWVRTTTGGGVPVDVGGVLLAVVTLGSVVLLLFVMGRLRAQQYSGGGTAADGGPRMYLPWISAGLALVVIGGGTWLARPDLVDRDVTAAFLSIVLGLVLLSLAVRWISARLGAALPGDGPEASAPTAHVRVSGDLLAGILLAFAVLGLVRSFAAPVLLYFYDGTDAPATLPIMQGALVVGVLGGIASLPLYRLAVARAQRRISTAADVQRADPKLPVRVLDTSEDNTDDPAIRWWGLGITLAAAALLVAFLIAPAAVSSTMGSVATLTAMLGCWSTVVGAAMIFLSRFRPLEVFRLVGLRTTPFLALFVVVPLVVTQVAGAPQLHAIEGDSGIPRTAPRPGLDVAMRDWLQRSAGCDVVPVSGGPTVRTLVLVAAEGGGIRAATWTQRAFDQLGSVPCGSSAVMLSSGVSGGSVGLVLARLDRNEDSPLVDDDPSAATAPQEQAAVLSDDALAVGIAGLFAGDLIGSLTGVRVPTQPGYSTTGAWEWQDRAALIQSSWRGSIPELGRPYDLTATGPTGLLVINSADALSRCKVVISQLDLHELAEGADGITCEGNQAELAGTIDLQDYYGTTCPFSLDWATVAALSARFPIVTPAGRVSAASHADCTLPGELQLVDGGYVDNSGLGTLSDLAPGLARAILAHNSSVDGTSSPFVVPVVVYLSNEPGGDILAEKPTARPELLVPLATKASAPLLQTEPATWLARLSTTLANVCPEADAACASATEGVRAGIPDGVVLVSPSTSPGISVPLGWVLSDLSRDHLKRTMDAQAKCRTPSNPAQRSAAQSAHGCLGDLLALLRG